SYEISSCLHITICCEIRRFRDLISCRNLLIYLDRVLQSQVCNTFHYALRPRGYLFLGASESIDGQALFRMISRDARIFQAAEGSHTLPPLPTAGNRPRISHTLEPKV